MRCEILAHQEKSGLPDKLHEDRSEKFAEDGRGSCESVERTSRGYRAHREVEIEETVGSSSRQDGIGFVITLDGSEQSGSGRIIDCPRWPRWLGRKEFGCEDRQESRRRLGGSRFSSFRRGGK